MPEPELKELLKRDFGLDLDIAGSCGQRRDDPMIVLSDTETEAAHTELLVLRSIGKGRHILWRSIGIKLISESSPQIIQRKIETKEVRSDEIITQIENYYILRKNLDTKVEQIQGQFVVHEDRNVNIKFPFELGWLHYDNIVDYEYQEPGPSYSLAYNAPAIKATVYVYPIRDGATSQPSPLHAELELARETIIHAYGEGAIEHDWEGVIAGENNLRYYFKREKGPEDTSLLMIFERNGYFIKLRCTFFDEPLMRDISNDFLESLLALIRSGDAPTIEGH